ncbi:tetratricopeptide repeat protein [Labilibacter marinus]|uniref:tetratricopeptide repeat protein n=1 Tax=Labilibacter marinus TaxID=1477105 RepID=UPI00130144E0|nr:tetratricopeptide repeat protein [Labilibacter marinus]
MPDLNEKFKSKSIRVFLSSTFADMQEEREYLINVVFPHLKRIAGKRGLDLTEVDLRWGITEEEAKNGKVVRLCLSEIDLCKEKSDELPFFIGIIGHRYGWQPTYADIEKDTAIIKDYPIVKKYIDNKLSVTEMEMDYAILGKIDREKQLANQAYFFSRSEECLEELQSKNTTINYYDEDKKNGETSLLVLKNRIKRELSNNQLSEYANKEELGQLVTNNFEAFLEEQIEFANNEELEQYVSNSFDDFFEKQFSLDLDDGLKNDKLNNSKGGYRNLSANKLDKENWQHACFAHNRLRYFVERDGLLQKIEANLKSNGKVFITGGVGSGKTSQMASYVAYKQRRSSNCEVFYHFCGGSMHSDNLDSLLVRLIAELQRYMDKPVEVPNEEKELLAAFIKEVSSLPYGKKYVFVIDAIDQLDNLNNFNWLPDVIPDHISILLSVKSPIKDKNHSAVSLLSERKYIEIKVEPLNLPEIEQIINALLGAYSKQLPEDLMREIVQDEESKNPLILRTLIEEVRLLGNHNTLKKDITNYITSSSKEAFFEKVLKRIERDFDGAKKVLMHLGVSRSGLTENEILLIVKNDSETNFTNLEWSGLYETLRPHLKEQDGVLTWFHGLLQKAVADRYHTDESKIHAYQKQQVAYFKKDPLSSRSLHNLPWLYNELKDWNELGNLLGDPNVFWGLYDGYGLNTELNIYIDNIDENFDLLELLKQNIAKTKDKHQQAGQLFTIAHYYHCLKKYNSVISIYEELNVIFHDLSKIDSSYLKHYGTVLNNVAILYYQIGDNDKSLLYYDKAFEINKESHSPNSEKQQYDKASLLNNIAAVKKQCHEYKEAKSCYLNVIDIYLALRSNHNKNVDTELATIYNNLGSVYHDLNDPKAAKEVYEKSLKIRRKQADDYGEQYLEGLATSLHNIGNDSARREEFEEAINAFKEAMPLFEKLNKKTSERFKDKYSILLTNYATSCYYLKQNELSESLHKKAITIKKQIYKEGGKRILTDLETSYYNLGLLYTENLKNNKNAFAAFKASLKTSEELVNQNRSLFLPLFRKSYSSLLTLGVDTELTNKEDAKNIFHYLINYQEQLPSNIKPYTLSLLMESHYRLGELFKRLGDVEKSIVHFVIAIKIGEGLPKKEARESAGYLQDLFYKLADIYDDVSHDESEIIELLEKSISIGEDVITNDKDKRHASKVLLFSIMLLGQKHRLQGRYADAKNIYLKGMQYGNRIPDNLDNTYAIARIWHGLALANYRLKKYDESETAYKKALMHQNALISELKSKQSMVSEYNSDKELGDILYNLGVLYYSMEDLENSMKRFEESIFIRRKVAEDRVEKHIIELVNSKLNLCLVYGSLKIFEKRAQLYNEIIKELIPLNQVKPKKHKITLADAYNNLLVTYHNLKKYDEAKKAGSAALDLFIELNENGYDYNNKVVQLRKYLRD